MIVEEDKTAGRNIYSKKWEICYVLLRKMQTAKRRYKMQGMRENSATAGTGERHMFCRSTVLYARDYVQGSIEITKYPRLFGSFRFFVTYEIERWQKYLCTVWVFQRSDRYLRQTFSTYGRVEKVWKRWRTFRARTRRISRHIRKILWFDFAKIRRQSAVRFIFRHAPHADVSTADY